MKELIEDIKRLPEEDRIPVARLTKRLLSRQMVREGVKENNPIRLSIAVSVLANAIHELEEATPEADEFFPVRTETQYTTDNQ